MFSVRSTEMGGKFSSILLLLTAICWVVSTSIPVYALRPINRSLVTATAEVSNLKKYITTTKGFTKIHGLLNNAVGDQSFYTYLTVIFSVGTKSNITFLIPTDAGWTKMPPKLQSRLSSAGARDIGKFLRFSFLKPKLNSTQLLNFPINKYFNTLGPDLMVKFTAKSVSPMVFGRLNAVVANRSTVAKVNAYVSPYITLHTMNNWLIPPSF